MSQLNQPEIVRQMTNTNKVDVKIVTVKNYYQLQQALMEFIRPVKQNDIKTEFEAIKQNGQRMLMELSFTSKTDYPSMLHEGFSILKKRQEAAQKTGLKIFLIDSRMWLDDLIERRLGGKREGLRVRWDLDDGIYRWDPFTKKLTKE